MEEKTTHPAVAAGTGGSDWHIMWPNWLQDMHLTCGPATLESGASTSVLWSAPASRQLRESCVVEPQLVQITGLAIEAKVQSREWWPNLPQR